MGDRSGLAEGQPRGKHHQALPKTEKAKGRRKALPCAEVASCLDAVRASGAGQATKLALELLVLTAARSGEVRMAVWPEFDLEAAV